MSDTFIVVMFYFMSFLHSNSVSSSIIVLDNYFSKEKEKQGVIGQMNVVRT